MQVRLPFLGLKVKINESICYELEPSLQYLVNGCGLVFMLQQRYLYIGSLFICRFYIGRSGSMWVS